MKKFGKMLILLLALSFGGCAAWFQELRTNPVAALSQGVDFIRTALGLAQGAFNVWAAQNPDQAPAVRARFDQVTAEVDRGLVVAQDGLRLAAHAGGPAPDVSALLQDAQHAIGSVNAFLAGLPGRGPGGATDPLMRSALEATQRASRRLEF